MPLFNSAKGPVLLFASSSINTNGTDSKGTEYKLSRTEQNNIGSTKQIPLLGMAKNFASFKKITGQTIVGQLLHQLKLNSEDALWQYIKNHPDFSNYGLMALNVSFRLAMGAAFIDEEVKDKKGKAFQYHLELSGANKNAYTSKIIIGQAPDFNPPKITQSKATDSGFW